MKNRNWAQEIKDWWDENKSAIKSGFAFGMIGAFAGFAAGMNSADTLWLEHGFERAVDYSDNPSDELGLAEENCDDPELLELIRLENEENSQ